MDGIDKMSKYPIVLMLLVVATGFAQEPMRPLSEYEKQSAVSAIQVELATVEGLARDPNITVEVSRKLNQYLAELKLALADTNRIPFDGFPNQIATIVNGTYTVAYPSVGALLHNGETVCTGTLIGNGSVLTARHCFGVKPDPKDFQVFLQHSGIRKISGIEFPQQDDVDLAVLCLERPATGIMPSSMPAALTMEGNGRKIVGFGSTSPNGSDSGVKRHGSIVTSLCSPASINHVCWVYDPVAKLLDPGSNVCGRDSGGPVGRAFEFELQFEDGVTSNVLPIGACATTSRASSVAVKQYTDELDDLIKACGGAPAKRFPRCCGGAVHVWAEDGILPSDDIHEKVWTFEVPEKIRLVTMVMNAFDMGGTNLEFEVLSPTMLPTDPGCMDLGRYVSCEYLFEGAPPSSWVVKITNTGGSGAFYQLIVTLYPEIVE